MGPESRRPVEERLEARAPGSTSLDRTAALDEARTTNAAVAARFPTEPLGLVQVRGKKKPVDVYAVTPQKA